MPVNENVLEYFTLSKVQHRRPKMHRKIFSSQMCKIFRILSVSDTQFNIIEQEEQNERTTGLNIFV